jgi:serine/threonine protein phosphatase PrpC
MKTLCEHYSIFGITHIGLRRTNNEDYVLIDKELGLFIVADGMGGHDSGEIASREAACVIQQFLKMHIRQQEQKSWLTRHFSSDISGKQRIKQDSQIIQQAIQEANRHVYALNIESDNETGSGMGTTIAGCWLISPNVLLIFHVGDSRVYRYNDQGLKRLTKDHSVLQEWLDAGSLGTAPDSNIILKAIGPFPKIAPDIKVAKCAPDDLFLICSDGLTDMIGDDEIEQVLNSSSIDSETSVQNLLKHALDAGGKDNLSILVLKKQN